MKQNGGEIRSNLDNKCMICNNELGVSDRHSKRPPTRNFINGLIGYYHDRCYYRYNNTCKVFFHNLKAFDSHILIPILKDWGEIQLISAKTIGKIDKIIFLPYKYYFRIQFLDSNNFLNSKLSDLISLVDKPKFSDKNEKLVFPYDWFDHPDKLYNVSLPVEDAAWYNKLTGKMLDKTTALSDFERLDCKNVRDYHNKYLESDILQLADVFENFFPCYL